MHDNQRSIEGQCIIKAVARVIAKVQPKNPDTTTIRDFIDILFDHFAAKLDAYAKLDIPLNAPGAPRNDVHLSDEQVARGVAKEADKAFEPAQPPRSQYTAPNGKTYAFASEKQGKRAYAIQKSKGWDDYQVRMLCQKYGFQSTKKIPVGVYEAFCNELQAGPQNSASSSHLEQGYIDKRDALGFDK